MKRPRYSGSAYDIPAVESWLEAQAREGWLLDTYFLGIRLRREEPRHVRYRMEPWNGPMGEPDDGQKALYEELGWEYVCDWVRPFRVFRSTVPDPVELHTDPVVESWNYRPLRRAMTARLCALFLAAALMAAGLPLVVQQLLRSTPSQRILYQVTPFDWVFYLLALPTLMEIFWGGFRDSLVIRRLYQCLQSGQRPEKSLLPSRRSVPRWLPPLRTALAAVVLLWMLTGWAMAHAQRERAPLADWEGPPPVVDLTALEKTRLGDAPLFDVEVSGGWSPLAPEQTRLNYYRQVREGRYRFELAVESYRLRGPGTAAALYADLAPEGSAAVEAEGFTDAALAVEPRSGRHIFVGLWENRILYLLYEEDGPLDLLADIVPAAKAAAETWEEAE